MYNKNVRMINRMVIRLISQIEFHDENVKFKENKRENQTQESTFIH